MNILIACEEPKIKDFLLTTLSPHHSVMLASDVKKMVENQLQDILHDPYLLLEFDLVILDKEMYTVILQSKSLYDNQGNNFGILYLVDDFTDEELLPLLDQTIPIFPMAKNIEAHEFLIKLTFVEKFLRETTALQRFAFYDPLTDLKNRRTFMESFARFLDMYFLYEIPFCLAIVDLDHFKQINDTYGHSTGDEVLKKFAHILSDACRKTDIVARIGGEEFALIFADINVDRAHQILDRIRTKVEEKFAEDGMNVTISGGLAEISKQYDSMEKLFAHADNHLYTSKTNGRNCITYK